MVTKGFCVCTVNHYPKVLEPQGHHLWPLYLGGPEHPATLVMLCPTTHTNVHRILRSMVHDGWRERAKGEPHYAHALATLGYQSWDAAGRPSA